MGLTLLTAGTEGTFYKFIKLITNSIYNKFSSNILQLLELLGGAGAPVLAPLPAEAALLPGLELAQHAGHGNPDVVVARLGGGEVILAAEPGGELLHPLSDCLL